MYIDILNVRVFGGDRGWVDLPPLSFSMTGRELKRVVGRTLGIQNVGSCLVMDLQVQVNDPDTLEMVGLQDGDKIVVQTQVVGGETS